MVDIKKGYFEKEILIIKICFLTFTWKRSAFR